MDDEFLNEYFDELNREVDNEEFITELKDQMDEIDKNKLEDLIRKYF